VSRGHSYEYDKWAAERMFAFVPAQAIVAEFLGTFKEFPPRQKPASFSVGDALSHLKTASLGSYVRLFIKLGGCFLTGHPPAQRR
jgi:hypothetical protein